MAAAWKWFETTARQIKPPHIPLNSFDESWLERAEPATCTSPKELPLPCKYNRVCVEILTRSSSRRRRRDIEELARRGVVASGGAKVGGGGHSHS